MWRVAFKGVLARKTRLLLTSIAIVLGVGFVAGAFFLTDSLRASFDNIFDEATQSIDVQVVTKEYKELSKRQATNGPAAVAIDLAEVGVKPETVEKIRRVEGVKRAVGEVFEMGIQPLGKDGKPIGQVGPPAFVANWDDAAPEVSAFRIDKGVAPAKNEVMLDPSTMKSGKFKLGDKVTMQIQGGRSTETFTISGVVKFGEMNNLNGASTTVFETSTVQRLLDMGDRFSAVAVQAKQGVTQDALKLQVVQALGPDFDVVTGKEFANEQSEAVDTGFLTILQNVILGFAAIAVFVGAFTIFNTFTILVGQRTREFGLLRSIGASRTNIITIVVVEAIILGLVAATIGIFAGYGVATLLRTLINSFADGGIPEAAFPLKARTIIAAYAVGVVVTLVSSLVPAWRASRLAPLEALRASSVNSDRSWKTPVFGLILVIVGSALIAFGFIATKDVSTTAILSRIGGGFALAIIGIALLSRLFIAPVTGLLGLVMGRGTVGQIATRNVLRNRARSASTAAALMIGLALASLVLVFYASLQSTVNRQIDETLGADITIYNSTLMTSGSGVVGDSALELIKQNKHVTNVAGLRIGGFVIGSSFSKNIDNIRPLVATSPDTLSADGIIQLKMVSGKADPTAGVLLERELAKSEKLKVGDSLKMAFSGEKKLKLKVAGIFESNPALGSNVVISERDFDAVQPPALRAPVTVFARTDHKTETGEVTKQLRRALKKDHATLEVQDSDDLRKLLTAQLRPILGLVMGMLSLSLVIALFGIGNTLALNVFERTREIGLFRAVGGTRGQLKRMIRIESVLVALFGAVIGVLVGIAAGRALVAALADDGFVFALNVGGLLAVLVAGIIAGLLASLLPARRAAKTDVLDAIATD